MLISKKSKYKCFTRKCKKLIFNGTIHTFKKTIISVDINEQINQHFHLKEFTRKKKKEYLPFP